MPRLPPSLPPEHAEVKRDAGNKAAAQRTVHTDAASCRLSFRWLWESAGLVDSVVPILAKVSAGWVAGYPEVEGSELILLVTSD